MGKHAVEPASVDPIAQATPAASAAPTPVVRAHWQGGRCLARTCRAHSAGDVRLPVFEYIDEVAVVPVVRVRQVPQGRFVETTNETSQGAARGGQDRSASSRQECNAQDDDAPHASGFSSTWHLLPHVRRGALTRRPMLQLSRSRRLHVSKFHQQHFVEKSVDIP